MAREGSSAAFMRLFFFFISAAFVLSPEVRLRLVPAGRLSSSSSIKMALEGTEPTVEAGVGEEDSPARVRAGGGDGARRDDELSTW